MRHFFSPFLVLRLLTVSVTVKIAVVSGGGKCLNYNLGENKWQTRALPFPLPPNIKDGKMVGFCPSLGFIVDLVVGGRGAGEGYGGLKFHFILSKIVGCTVLNYNYLQAPFL